MAKVWAGAVLGLLAMIGSAQAVPCDSLESAGEKAACDAAIAAEKDKPAKAALLYKRAYAKNEVEDYESALADLTAAKALDPQNANVLHERGYTLNALGEYRAAEADLSAEIKLMPARPNGYNERAFGRFYAGDLAGAYADRDKNASLTPDDASAIAARANVALWLGRFDDAKADYAAARAIAQKNKDDSMLASLAADEAAIGLWQTTSGGPSPGDQCDQAQAKGAFEQDHLIGDCTAAFLTAPTNAKKAEALTVRAIAWLTAKQDEDRATVDSQLAIAFDPENAMWHSNLGFAYLRAHHSWGARKEFDRALALNGKHRGLTLAGRAAANYNLSAYDAAFDDAKKSFELEPNETALEVLGDLVWNQKQDSKAAKEFWMGAYRMGDRSDGLTDRLKSIGVTEPDKEPPK